VFYNISFIFPRFDFFRKDLMRDNIAMKELHIASENFAGVPYSLVRAERKVGIDSDIITLMPSKYGHPQEKTLDLPLFSGRIVKYLRKWTKSSATVDNTRYKGVQKPPIWNPSLSGKYLFSIRDKLWEHKLLNNNTIQSLDKYSAIILDGGVGFLRSGKFVLDWTEKHKNLITIYYGSELRKRGVIKEIDDNAKYVFTFEFDHTLIHPRAKFLFYPFFADDMPSAEKIDDGKIRIGHSPTRRSTKGTEIILDVLKKLSKRFKNIEIVLIENLPYDIALRKKSELDIFIDQLGELGYGISGLESLAMGIPTVCQILPDFEKFLSEHPFVNADEQNLEDVLMELIESPQMRTEFGEKGKLWVRKVHNPVDAIEPLLETYREEGWI